MTFQKGMIGNPSGKNTVTLDYPKRVGQIFEHYIADEIKDIVEDQREFGKLKVIDAMIMKRMYEGLYAKGGDSVMESLLNRLIGKVDSNLNVNTNFNMLVTNTAVDRDLLGSIKSEVITDASYAEVKD